MKLPCEWLSEYIDLNGTDAGDLAQKLTMSGSKVEAVEYTGEGIENIVIGHLLEVSKHSGADKLLITKVDIGTGIIQVVTGAENVKEGQYVPVAVDGSFIVGGRKIKKGKLRGELSEGMLCSLDELGLTAEDWPGAIEDGIMILSDVLSLDKLIPGNDVKSLLGLGGAVIDLEITPNRPDCLSIHGMAREVAATLKAEVCFKKPEVIEKAAEHINDTFNVNVRNTELCPRYACRMVKNVRIEPSPDWMRIRLRASGIRPINNIVDITNYVMLEYGQPMHAFDLRCIEGNEIIVRNAKDNEIMETLDGQNRKLDSSMLMICDVNKPIAMAGVMGGANSEISGDTDTIVFESANFNRVAVRKASRKAGLRTESSSRFEKGLDPENVLPALQRAVELIEILGAGTVLKGIIDIYPNPVQERYVAFSPANINALLGTDISEKEMTDILCSVGLKSDNNGTGVKIPSFRQDIECEADLAEEVARLYGYNKIPPTLPGTMTGKHGGFSEYEKIVRRIRDTMVAGGYAETCTYSFCGTKELDKIRAPEDSTLRKAVVIENPLGEDFSIMRTTTLPQLLSVIALNYNHGNAAGCFFEISNTYSPLSDNEDGLPLQTRWLTAGIYGKGNGYYEIKGAIENVFRMLGIKEAAFRRCKDNPSFHPGRTALIVINGEEAGIIGELHPETLDSFKAPGRACAAILRIDALVNAADFNLTYVQLPRFPSVTRDLAIIINDDIEAAEIENSIRSDVGKILEDVTLFDLYKGQQVPENMKSIAYSLSFRAKDRTLTDEETDKIMNKILNGLTQRFQARLR